MFGSLLKSTAMIDFRLFYVYADFDPQRAWLVFFDKRN